MSRMIVEVTHLYNLSSWSIRSTNGQFLASSCQNYRRKDHAVRSAKTVVENMKDAELKILDFS